MGNLTKFCRHETKNALECVLIRSVLTVPLRRVILKIEVGKLGIFLIPVQPAAGGNKILVDAEGV